ncbi:MAG: glycoside hydrolase family 95 protein [Clostridia bacterium]|nr:glycoside hydrolase family 95 protein [Clostridia bacterium]
MDKLRYVKPAKKWIDALPLGNGKTGVMVYGGVKSERLAFNNSTLWSGYPKDHDNPESLKFLDEVRELIFKGENHLADKLVEEKLDGAYSEGYLPLGYIDIAFKGVKTLGYERTLDISKAIFTTKQLGFIREAFCNYPSDVFVYKALSKKPFDLTITTKSKLRSEAIYDGKNVILRGQAPDHVVPSYVGAVPNAVQYDKSKGMAFSLCAYPLTDGVLKWGSRGLSIKGATTLTLFVTTETGFVSYDRSPITSTEQVVEKCLSKLNSLTLDYDALKAEHVKDYTELYDRHSLSFGGNANAYTDSIFYKAKLGKITPELVELFFNYGKYLTIAGSRKGGQALNLQGIWNDSVRPPWSSNYTTNINAQMNYWPTSQIGLSECLIPYLDMVNELKERGKSTAKVNYGASGFCVNHNTDIWRKTAPVQGNPQYMFAPLCGAWLTNEIYEHYSYGDIPSYTDKIKNILSENVKFILDYLVEHDGFLVTCPSASPENAFSKDGKRCYLDYASAFEVGIVRQSLNDYLELIPSGELSDKVKEALTKLYPFQEDIDGIVEWSKYYPTPEMGHRHFSPLYAFHPARQIGYYSHPEQREWVRRLMHTRIYNVKQYFGWSGAWALALAARLREKDTCALVISRVLGKAIFKNLFDMHPPRLFQIDGNFGFVHGVNEMLCQIENGVAELLPALPDFLLSGEVKGQRLRGGYAVDFKWENGLVTHVTAHSTKPLKIRDLHLDENITLVNAEVIK